MVLTITKERIEPGILVLKLVGRLTLGRGSQELEWQIKELVEKGEKKIVLDMSKLTYMDSTGLGILALTHGKLKECGGELRMAGFQDLVKGVLELTGLAKVINAYPSVEDATRDFSSGASGGAKAAGD